ncbi:MAG: hypothetical protein K5694_00300 [Bacilli bacterium]|nr:hypothetical protein [Bacilli bacterium]
MKKVGLFLTIIPGVLGGLLALVFIFTNLRFLFQGDFLAYAVPSAAIIQSLFKIMGFLVLVGAAIFPFFRLKDEKFLALKPYYYIFGLGAFLVEMIFANTLQNVPTSAGVEFYITLALRIIYAIYLVGLVLYFLFDFGFVRPKEKKKEAMEDTPQ